MLIFRQYAFNIASNNLSNERSKKFRTSLKPLNYIMQSDRRVSAAPMKRFGRAKLLT